MPKFVKEAVLAGGKTAFPEYLAKDFAALNNSRVFTEKRFGSILNNDLYNALKISPLPSLLHIDDRSSMAHSVESRAPFLDYRLVEFVFSLGPEYKIRNGITKYILREALKGVLPEKVCARRDKMGFATPLEKWFRTSLKERVAEIFHSAEFLSLPYFNNGEVLRTFDRFVSGRCPEGLHLTIWGWVNLELWFRKFMR
jgi:asparagine synthase (glutamine-hydrolysing)